VTVVYRTARPDDHQRIVAVLDEWWERPVAHALPRLFLDHFWPTSLVAERDGELAGFLVGLLSPGEPECAYAHFVGVAPTERGTGVGRELYQRFADLAHADGRTVIRAITSPVNEASVRFHRSLGFTARRALDYRAPGRPMVVFERQIGTP
jgi:ribosomal protein S18 acetylase RimI-like enzyme